MKTEILILLNKIKPIDYFYHTDYLTMQQVAEYFNVEYDAIRKLISRHKEELIKEGILILNGKECRNFLIKNNIFFTNIQGGFNTFDKKYKFSNRISYFINTNSLIYISFLLTESDISIKLKQEIGFNKANLINRKEIIFLDQLEETLKPFNIKGVRQYQILNYRIDFYIPSLNIAIEYDEDNHNRYTYNQQEGRQREIEEEIKCKFIRVTDYYSNEYNIGYVIKNIFF